MEHFSDESIGMDRTAKGPRLGIGKTLANYEELAEGLEHIDKQLEGISTRILGRPEPTDTEQLKKGSEGERAEPGYIERFDDVAVRMRASVNNLSRIVDRLNDAI